MKTLEIQSLTKWYGSVCGIEDVSFDIEQGEIFGYLGPNGSGKSTTIRCIMGLLKATNGQARIFGRQVRPGLATEHNRIGYLPGDFRIWRGLLSGSAAGVSLLGAALFRTRGRAVGLAMSFFIVSYFINIIAEWLPRAEFLGPTSIFYYVDPSKILMDTAWPIRDMCVLGSILIVTVIAGGIIWNRRDLPL